MVPELNLILLGPPGAGKGTQAAHLGRDLCLPSISTGEMLRDSVANGTRLGQAAQTYMTSGSLVPDDLIIDIVTERLTQADAADGFILDGFPRTTAQATALAQQLGAQGRHIATALLLDVPDEEIVKRIDGRRVCAKCGHSYHVEHQKPQSSDLCDQDGSPLIQRDDDKREIVERRLEEYHRQTAPLVDYYGERSLLSRIDGLAPQGEVYGRIQEAVATLR
jgi:adenylate kinase